MVKEFLSHKGISFEEKDVSLDHLAAQELVSKTGQMGVPVTFINGESIIGFDRTRLEDVIRRHAEANRPSFGVAAADAGKIAARQGSGTTFGAYVGKVRPGSAADRLGLITADVITKVNTQNISNAEDLELALSKLTKGTRISVVFLRGSKQLTADGTY